MCSLVPEEANLTVEDCGKERRSWERRPAGPTVPSGLIVSVGKESRWARVRDVSVSGIGLLLAAPIDPGTVLSVRLRAPGEPAAKARPAVVVHAAQAGASWVVGCAFKTPLTLQQFQALT
jgi:hypothetical protein